MKKYLAALIVLCMTQVALASEKKIRRAGPDAIPGQYIVGLKNRNPNEVRNMAKVLEKKYEGAIRFVFDALVGGFSVEMSDGAAQLLANDPRVAFVEENVALPEDPALSAVIVPTAQRNVSDPYWYLDRLDQTTDSLDGYHNYCRDGTGVLAYVVDGGVRASHPEFLPGQVLPGADFANPPPEVSQANNPCTADSRGWHGTAVAAIIGGQVRGVASGVKIIPVRTHFCPSGSSADRVIAGLNWIISNNYSSVPGYSGIPPNPNRYDRPAVVNLSFYRAPLETSGSHYTYPLHSIEYALHELIDAGLTVVTSANNFSDNACNRSPANLGRNWDFPQTYVNSIDRQGDLVQIQARVITVGGTMRGDTRWQEYSNGVPLRGVGTGSSYGNCEAQDYQYGEPCNLSGGRTGCVSIFAPSWNFSVAHHQEAETFASGTSFAAPQAAGVAARYLEDHQTATPEAVWGFISTNALNNQVLDSKSNSQLLLHMGSGCRRRAVRR